MMLEALSRKLLRKAYGDVSDRELLERFAEFLGVEVDRGPQIDKVLDVSDKPGKCYLVNLDADDLATQRFAATFQDEFTKHYGRGPSALYLVRNDIEGVKNLSATELEERVSPWLNNQD
jgi:hypothetical protein